MSELRKDLITREWVIMAPERARRPSDFHHQREAQAVVTKNHSVCPFCSDNESMTPQEILAYRGKGAKPNSSGWWVRVIPNRFPALMVEGKLNRTEHLIYDKMNGVGAHEVVIESTNHKDSLSSVSDKQFEDILWSYRDRIIDLKKDPRFRYVLIFKNHGEAAGASLEHTHSQLIALPIIPKRVAEELDGSLEYYNYKERCIFCDIIRQDIMQGIRIVAENPDFIAVTPYAPKAPFEIWILPKKHDSSFENAQKHQYENLATLFSNTLKRMDKVLNSPPYNFILHTSPFKNGDNQHYHWHFEIMPTLVKVAGFEWGSGFYINPTPPEEAAKFLREAKI